MSARKSSEVQGTDAFIAYRGFFLPPHFEEERIKNHELDKFELTEDDVLVVGFPKSGATRMSLLLREMYTDWGLVEAAGRKVVPFVEWAITQFHTEGATGIAKKSFVENPTLSSKRRLLKSRLPFSIMPAKLREKKMSKVIYMTRNPKDVCVNYYHFESALIPANRDDEPIPFGEFVQNFADGLVVYGPWLNHVSDWWAHREDANVLHVTYEELMRTPESVVRKVAEFLGRPLDEKDVKKLSSCRPDGVDKDPGNKGVQKGIIGEWKKHFSEEQSKLFDQDIGVMLKGKGLDFLYTPYQ